MEEQKSTKLSNKEAIEILNHPGDFIGHYKDQLTFHSKLVGAFEKAIDSLEQEDEKEKSIPISEAIKIVNKSIYDLCDVCDDNSENPMSKKNELLSEINKTICKKLEQFKSTIINEELYENSKFE